MSPSPLSSHLVCVVADKVYIMYHGTTLESAALIEQKGFRASDGGLLGPGVYVSRNMQNNMQLLKSICRIVHCLYSAYSAYICTPHFADGVSLGGAAFGSSRTCGNTESTVNAERVAGRAGGGGFDGDRIAV